MAPYVIGVCFHVSLCSQLKTHARAIYDIYLSESAPHSVNIDDTVKMEEQDLEKPTPEMFSRAQEQVCLQATQPVCLSYRLQ